MINKNQYKVRNVKKVLHKVGKNWLVMSTALLGMVAGGAAAGTATHADTTPVNANHSDGYVNHQVTQSAGSASPQLVHSDGTSLASASTSSSVASNNVSPSASKSTTRALNTGRDLLNSGTSSSLNNNRLNKAQRTHSNVANETRINSVSSRTMLGKSQSKANPSSTILQNATPDSLLAFADANDFHRTKRDNGSARTKDLEESSAYVDLMNRFSGLATLDINYSHSIPGGITFESAYASLSGINRDLNSVNDPHNYLASLKSPLNSLTSDMSEHVKNPSNASADFALGTGITYINSLSNISVSEASNITTAISYLASIQNTTQAKFDFGNIFSNLASLPNDTEDQKRNTLDLISHDLTDITSMANNASVNLNLKNFASELSTKSNQLLDNASLDIALTNLDTFNKFESVINKLTSSNFSKRDAFNKLIKAAENDLHSSNASGFVSAISKGLNNYGGTDAKAFASSLNSYYRADSSSANAAYNDIRTDSNAVDNLLNDTAKLNANNMASGLSQIATDINNNKTLYGTSALNAVANSASNYVASYSASEAYSSFTKNTSSLFSNVVNDITSKGFNSPKFKRLVGYMEDNLSNSDYDNDGAFVDALSNQLGSFTGNTPKVIKSDLTSLVSADNPELSEAYQAVRASSTDADDILNDLSSLTTSNKTSELNNISGIMQSHFSNSVLFGSLTSGLVSSASNNTQSSATQTSTNSQNSTNSNGVSSGSTDQNTSNPNGSSDVDSGGKSKSASPSGTDNSTKPSNPTKPKGSNGTSSRDSSGNKNGKASINANASYLASLSNSESEQSTLASETSVSNSISASESVASASAAASESSEEAAKSFLNSIINNNAQSNNKVPQTPSLDDNNSASSSTSNGNGNNNTLDSSSNDDSNSASQSQFSFTDNASAPSSSNVQSSMSTSTKANLSSASNVNRLSVGQQVDYHGMTVTRKRPTYRWFEISKTCLAHNTLDSVGKVEDYGAVLSPGMKVRLDKIFKVNVGHRTVYRYEINISGHDYFVTGNHHFTNDAYYRASDFKGRRTHGRYGHRYFEAIVKKPFMIYDSSRFNKGNQLWKSRRGQLIDIKGVHKVGNVTRLALIDGTYITANREFLKLI